MTVTVIRRRRPGSRTRAVPGPSGRSQAGPVPGRQDGFPFTWPVGAASLGEAIKHGLLEAGSGGGQSPARAVAR